jgi:hypothetical protein
MSCLQLSAPAAELAHAAALHGGHSLAMQHNPSPLGSLPSKKQQLGAAGPGGSIAVAAEAGFIKAAMNHTAAGYPAAAAAGVGVWPAQAGAGFQQQQAAYGAPDADAMDTDNV